MKITLSLVTILMIPLLGVAKPSRITAVHFNKGEVARIYMAPGLASVLTFPCEIDEAVIGRSEDLKAQVSPTTKKQLTLFLSTSAALHTNLLVRCGDKADLFVFDVIVSRSNHQDVVKIQGYFGGPELVDSTLRLIESSETYRPKKIQAAKLKKKQPQKRSLRVEVKKPVLVERGEM